jgi:glyoxylase-like metal-dependent hydrolase (beta-lactamase superfamily II)
MKLYPVLAGNFKLDGGAMFGVVPKVLWQKTNPADENNLCTWTMRSLLVETGDHLVLIDDGIGDKQDEKFFSHFYLHGDDTLEKSLAKHGFSYDDITDVLLTHLHFDHCGGSIKRNEDGSYVPAFKNARFWSNKEHWKWATEPNSREKASFLKENILPIEESGQLHFVDTSQQLSEEIFPSFRVLFFNGHTEAMMAPQIEYKGRTLVFMTDLLASVGHIPLPYVMGYDTRPLQTMDEKEVFMRKAADEEYILFFEHDPVYECCTVQHTEKGVRLKEAFQFRDVFGD